MHPNEHGIVSDLPRARAKIAVIPLDESKNVGWTDEKTGRFCLPMSEGYYVKFPKEGDPTRMFAVWFFTTLIGGSSNFQTAKRIAQEHHERRIMMSVRLIAADEQSLT